MMLFISILIILIHTAILVKSNTVSADIIWSAIVTLIGFNLLLALFGLTVLSIAFLVIAIAGSWVFDIVKKPRLFVCRLPGGLNLGIGVSRETIGGTYS